MDEDKSEAQPRAREARLSPASTAALLSFLWPGLGQAYHGRRRPALAHALPPAIVVLALTAILLITGPLLFGLYLFNPLVSLGLIAVIAALAAWRVGSIIDAGRPRSRHTSGVIVVLVLATVLSHGWLANNAWAFYEAGQRISEPIDVGPRPTVSPSPAATSPAPSTMNPSGQPPATASATPGATPTPAPPLPGSARRVTILFIGVDNTHAEDRGLTDTLIVASFDPIGRSVTMISVPRDTARLPLYSGGEYFSRINTLSQAASRYPEKFPDGPIGTLVNELSYIVGIPIDYYARIDISGFTQVVDAVGGVDITVDRAINDSGYQFTPTEVGFYLEPGPHHLDGKLATAYARSRHGPGNSDYERARRQQQILLALRARLEDPGILANLPDVLFWVSSIIRTDAPLDRLPEIVSIALSSATAGTRQLVLSPPRYAQRAATDSGASTFATQLRMDEVARLSIELFGNESRYAELAP